MASSPLVPKLKAEAAIFALSPLVEPQTQSFIAIVMQD
jgi:hypothetical protein